MDADLTLDGATTTTTLARKRRMGLRDLWDVIVNNDDICFAHILPRLNPTDIKFLYEVNSETRALVKRSSREEDLEESFNISEMSSISTLEIALNNVRWGRRDRYGNRIYESWFCSEVASTNKLELLKWVREEIKFDWDSWTIEEAAKQGNLEMVKYCVANECPYGKGTCACAAANGHLECLKYLHETVKAPWDEKTASGAAENGHLHILEYLVEHKYGEFDTCACKCAAENGHLECLKFLHEVAKAPWCSSTADMAASYGHLHILKYLVECEYDEFDYACASAAKNGELACLKYLYETAAVETYWDEEVIDSAMHCGEHECAQYLAANDCPMPEGWWYEDGTLFCEDTINHAAEDGNLEMIKSCLARNCPMNGEEACAYAASGGSLETLKYLHEEVKAPWDYKTSECAARNGHLHILEYLVESDYGFTETFPCYHAAERGHLDCLKYLHETAKAPWVSWAVRFALEKNHSECLQYLLDNNCPLPEGWRYEHGKLYT